MVFTKHAGNPLLNIGAAGTWDDVHISIPSVIYRDHKYYMYYNGNDGACARIGLATSPDGISWTKHASNPVLNLGAGGTWDDVSIDIGSVLYRDHKYYMYYNGYDGANAKIGLATSPDGISWTKHASNPVLNLGAGGTWDAAHVSIPSVIYRDHKYYMCYNGSDGVNIKIGLATSPDGISWTKHASNPVLNLGAGGTWDDVHVYRAIVLYKNHKWYMYYSGYDGISEKIGLATSVDGISWTKYTANPILDKGAGGTWDSTYIYKPSVIYRDHKYYMYYSGYDGANTKIGLATSATGV